MKTVASILKSKDSSVVHTIEIGASVFDAVKLMGEKNIGALIVMDGDQVAGIISERDYARKIVLLARSSKDTPLRDVMNSPVTCVRPHQTSDECMVLMTEKRFRHLPVLGDDGRLIGLISIGDLVKDIISEQQFIIEQLEHYITGAQA